MVGVVGMSVMFGLVSGLRAAGVGGAGGVDPVSLVGLAGTPLVVAMVELVKVGWPELESRWYPVLSLGFAVALNVLLAVSAGLPMGGAVVVGVVTGLSASGMYSWGSAGRSAGVERE